MRHFLWFLNIVLYSSLDIYVTYLFFYSKKPQFCGLLTQKQLYWLLSCPFYGSPLYAFFCWILKMEAFFRPVDHMIYGDTNVVKVSSQATESSRKSSRFIEKLLCWAKTSRLSRLEMKNRKTKLRTAARDYSAHFSIKIQLLWCSWKWWSKCQKARNRKKAENGSNFKLIYHKQ